MIEVRHAGVTPEGADVDEVVIAHRQLEVRVLTLGATLASVSVPDRDGRPGPVTLTLPNLADRFDRDHNPYLGATVGRWANRIADARFTLDGREVRLAPNEGRNQLHGGPDGFDRRVWELLQLERSRRGGEARFALRSPDGDQGFPGDLRVLTDYRVALDSLFVAHEATTDAPTVVNLTNHAYWKLDDWPTVADHHLLVDASHMVPVDEQRLPTGPPVPVEGTPFDLRSGRRLGDVFEDLPDGLDHCYLVDDEPGTSFRRAAVLWAPATGRWLVLSTDQPGLQVYTGNGLGPPFPRFGAVCLEPQRPPDAPNRPELGPSVLRPGEHYRWGMRIDLATGRPPVGRPRRPGPPRTRRWPGVR